MKIILVIPTLKQGGAERVMSELANDWSSQGHEVHIVLLAKAELFYDLNGNVTVHKLEFNYSSMLNKIYMELLVFFTLRNIIADIKPTFILSFMTKYNVLSIFASLALSTKVFISDRSSPAAKFPFLLSILRKLTYRYANGIIAQTNFAKEILINETHNHNVTVIFNPLRKVTIYPNVQREKIIINVGRFVTEKGHSYLLDAFSMIKDTEWKLIILGDGPLRNNLEKQITALGIDERVLLPGTIKDVDLWLAKASIFAFSSISEGFPNALAEAMVAGLPCVSFNCNTGPSEIINNGKNGYLVTTGDVNAFARQLQFLIDNELVRHQFSKAAIGISDTLNLKKLSNEYLSFCLN